MTIDAAYVEAWARAFVLTQLVEVPVYLGLARVGVWRALSLSAVTHPCVWFVFPPLALHLGIAWDPMLYAAELFAWLVEAALLRGYGVRWPRALVAALAANATSVAVGELTRALWGFP